MMQTRRRTVVYWPSHRRQSVSRLNVEQLTLASVDEAEETEFERTKVKYTDDLFSSIKELCEPNNNLSNEIVFELENGIDIVSVRTQGAAGCPVKRKCNQDYHGLVLAPEIISASASTANAQLAVRQVGDNKSCSQLSSTLIDQQPSLSTNTCIESDQAPFNLANLRDSLPRLVIRAPERLHDEVTGAFTLYSGVDTPHASLWSARVNFACTTSNAQLKSDDAEALDTSCCSMDSAITASSIDSGPRTFYDPALHRPLHFSGAVVTPVCSGAEIGKKALSQSPPSVHKGYDQELMDSIVPMDHVGCGASSCTVNSINIQYNPHVAVRKPPNALGRAVTKLTFSPHKPDSDALKLRENVQKRDWRNLYSSSPIIIKRSCQRSITPKFEPMSSGTSRISSHRTVSPVFRDHRHDVSKCSTALADGYLSDLKLQKSPNLLLTSPRRVPPRYSARRELATAWDCKMLQKTVDRDCRAEVCQKPDSSSVTVKHSLRSSVVASTTTKRNALAPTLDNILYQRPINATALLGCSDEPFQSSTSTRPALRSQRCQYSDVLRPTASKKQPDRLHWHPSNAIEATKLHASGTRRVKKAKNSVLSATLRSSPVRDAHLQHMRSVGTSPFAVAPMKHLRNAKSSSTNVDQ